jgi:hypothetical protein
MSRKTLTKEKFQYFRPIFIKWADIFTTDKGVFIAHIPKRTTVKNCFEVKKSQSPMTQNQKNG